MLLSKTVMVKWNGRNREWYEKKGYIYTKRDNLFEVTIKDLQPNCSANIKVMCDSCRVEKEMRYCDYMKNIKPNNKYYCHKCAINLDANKEKIKKSKLKNSITFFDWCVKNNFIDALNRWDLNLNGGITPKDISYGTTKSYYFKCNDSCHESELKKISTFTGGCYGIINCKKCNSMAQFLINTYGGNAIKLYWSNKNTVNPWEIDKCSTKKIWIKCQNKDKPYHEDYLISCGNIVNGAKCPYCTNHKIHPLDSLGKLLEDEGLLNLWSDKNKNNPYTYSPWSKQKVWWKCPNGEHNDFYRKINNSNYVNFRCPECDYSKGENKISEYLMNNKIKYIPQKEYNELLGLGGGNLSYDFYLEEYNLLIEYQGEQHEKSIDFRSEGVERAEKRFRQQQEHDKRKKQYAIDNNIKLLEIWYWDFDNIEKILDKKLKLNNDNNDINTDINTDNISKIA